MGYKIFHPRDEQLLLDIDGELSSRAARRIQAHLRACWKCRTHRYELESAITTFVRAGRSELDNRLPPGAGPRVLLKSRLVQAPLQTPVRLWRRLHLIHAFSGAACCALTFGLWAGIHHSQRRSRPAMFSVPDSALTPGATILANTRQVCALEDINNKNVTAALRKSVFKEYGIVTSEPGEYEIDYLITPGLGGADDIRNLWPHSYSSVWNARVKDELERRLRDLVCSGDLDLTEAQREIASNWIVAYKKYFHTDRPLTAETSRATHITEKH